MLEAGLYDLNVRLLADYFRRDDVGIGLEPRNPSNGKTGFRQAFNATKGYGFIQPDGGSRDVFVHISAVEKAGLSDLREGDKVTFDIVSNRGKELAENLKVK